MFSPNRKRPDVDSRPKSKPPKKPMSPEVKQRVWATVILTVILLIIWFVCMALGETRHDAGFAYAVMTVYFVIFAGVLIAYLAYNRAFVNKDVTVDMLPVEWSYDRKVSFVEDNRRRAEKSRWMVTVIIPFAVVFLIDALYLFIWDPYFADLFNL